MPTRITDGSGTSAQIFGLLASIKPAADDELTLFDEVAKLLAGFELAITTEDASEDSATDAVDERREDTAAEDGSIDERAEDTGVTPPQGAPLTVGISAFAAPLVP